jgi:hypothetical protein
MRSAERLGLALCITTMVGSPSWAAPATVMATPVARFFNVDIGSVTQGLVFEGGLEMQSDAELFGGLSGIGFTGPNGQLVMVSDRGNFVSGRLLTDADERPAGLADVLIEPIENSSGAPLPNDFTRDSEALSVIQRNNVPVAVRVGFENLTRVADFALTNGVAGGPAKELSIPDWLAANRSNESIESVCIAPPASPIAGSTLVLSEGGATSDGAHIAYLVGKTDKGALSYRSGSGTNPSDCAFLPNGDLLVLERGVQLVSFAMRLVRVKAANVKPGAEMTGDVLLEGIGGDLDNMEGVAVHPTASGKTRITLISDNNFNGWERNLLLEFSLPQ